MTTEKLETLTNEYAEKMSVYEALDKRDKYFKAAFEAGIITEVETESEQATIAAMKELGIRLDYLKTEIKTLERQHGWELEKICFSEIIHRIAWILEINEHSKSEARIKQLERIQNYFIELKDGICFKDDLWF